jgi:RNA polymerase sigma factor (TIGR02999 family)
MIDDLVVEPSEPQNDPQRFARIYRELHAIAESWFRGERRDHTLQATALVHEAFLRLRLSDTDATGDDRILAVAARTMRRVLVDHARRHARRGGSARSDLSVDLLAGDGIEPADAAVFDELIERLDRLDETKARVVEMRVIGGYTIDEVATALGCAPSTVSLHWRVGRAWIRKELEAREEP